MDDQFVNMPDACPDREYSKCNHGRGPEPDRPEFQAEQPDDADREVPQPDLPLEGAARGPPDGRGNLVVGNAEVISATALIQLAYPGAPVFYAAAQTASDPRTGAYTGGGPEDYLFGAATNALADFYNIPLSMGSFATGAKEPNWQAGVDNSLSTFMACAAMSDMLLGVGFLHGSRIWSYAQMLMDCEIFSIVHKMMQGIPVDDETLALETIQAVGPGGNFLTQKHTRRHMKELFLPQFMDRRPYNEWEARRDGAVEWATEKARQILASHQPDPLDPSLSAELQRILDYADEKLAGLSR